MDDLSMGMCRSLLGALCTDIQEHADYSVRSPVRIGHGHREHSHCVTEQPGHHGAFLDGSPQPDLHYSSASRSRASSSFISRLNASYSRRSLSSKPGKSTAAAGSTLTSITIKGWPLHEASGRAT